MSDAKTPSTLDIDVVHTDYPDQVVAQLNDYGLTHDLLDLNGPAGGNPLIRVHGPRAAILLWVANNNGDNGVSEFAMHHDQVKDALTPPTTTAPGCAAGGTI
jgi:hypothetical protein